MGVYLIKVNDKAPVIARSEIEINSAPETVWNLLKQTLTTGPNGILK